MIKKDPCLDETIVERKPKQTGCDCWIGIKICLNGGLNDGLGSRTGGGVKSNFCSLRFY